jgi:glycerophosphoryl diester phosphodiesterase
MLYLAHRGIWRGGDVENTLSAFDRVVDRLSPNLGLLHGFECDVRQCDLEDPTSWVVFHDDTWDRLTSQKGALYFPSRPMLLLQDGVIAYMPTLIDFCNWAKTISGCSITINIEIKHGSPEGVAYLLSQLCSVSSDSIKWIVSSFNTDILRTVACVAPTIAMSGLLQSVNDLSTLNAFPGLAFIAMRSDRITPDFCTELKQRDIGLGIYFNTLDAYKTWKNSGVVLDGLCAVFTEEGCDGH